MGNLSEHSLIKRESPSEAKKGIKNPMFGVHLIGEKSSRFGKKHKIETRIKLSEKRKGSLNPSWKGGVTSENAKLREGIELRLWRESVFARDNWTCQKCGIRGWDLQAHHIKSFKFHPELRTAIDNGQTLCFDCHKLTYNFCRREEKK